jgi:hypothetical protein
LVVGRHFALVYIEANAISGADIMHDIKEGGHVLLGLGHKSAIVRILFAGESDAGRGDATSIVRGFNSSNERIEHEVENER